MRIFRFLIPAAILLFFTAGDAFTARNDLTEGRKELERIKREMLRKKKELRQADRKEHSILTDLDEIDREIQAGRTALPEQQKRLREAERALRDLELDNTEISRELAGLRRVYGRRVRALYKMSRNGYADVLFGDGDSARRIKYLAMIAEQDSALIRDYASTLSTLSARQAALSEKREAILQRKRAIEIEKNELVARKRKKAVFLARVRKEKNLYEQTLQELEESSSNLWAMVQKAEKQRRPLKRATLSMPVPGSGSDRLPWPLQGRVITRFGRQRHPEFKTMVFRRGIEIAAREGDPVRAVSDGQAVYADWYKGYGKLIIIEHGPGFYTLYGNLSRVDLNKGDPVSQGQIIGRAGDTGSLIKGSKLYFEIRRNGEAQDPLIWLAKR